MKSILVVVFLFPLTAGAIDLKTLEGTYKCGTAEVQLSNISQDIASSNLTADAKTVFGHSVRHERIIGQITGPKRAYFVTKVGTLLIRYQNDRLAPKLSGFASVPTSDCNKASR